MIYEEVLNAEKDLTIVLIGKQAKSTKIMTELIKNFKRFYRVELKHYVKYEQINKLELNP